MTDFYRNKFSDYGKFIKMIGISEKLLSQKDKVTSVCHISVDCTFNTD